MNNSLISVARGALGLLGTLVLLSVSAYAQDASKAPAVRPEVGKPLQSAIDLLKARKSKDALLKLKEVDAVANKTAYENYLLDRVRGQAAAAAGEASVAGKSLESAATSPAAPGTDRLALMAGAAGQYYLAKDYAKSADLAGRYLKEGGTDPALRTLLVQALYLGNDLARAGDELAALLKDQEASGKPATEEQLQLYSSICLKRHDTVCYTSALEKLLTRYPKPDYWLTAIYELTKAPGFPSRHSLDVARLKLATGTMRTAGEYFEAAQLSLQDGFPIEAKDIVDRGYAAGLLGHGDEADRHRRLRDMVNKAAAEDAKLVGKESAPVGASAKGAALLNIGFNYVLYGQSAQGLALMEQGLQKGGFKRPEDARLRLGIAQAMAGQGKAAARTFATVQGADGTAELARLWGVAAIQRDAHR